MNDFLTLEDVAKMLRVSKPTVRRAVLKQGLPALRLGERVWRFKRADVEEFVASGGIRNWSENASLDRAPAGPGVYAVRHGRFIKIGRAANVRERLRGIQSHCPGALRFLGLLSSTPSDEGKFHARFRRLRVRGEWFRSHKTIIKAVIP